ncbi:hypothetical protein CsSME_00027733 [Camellia sinensis var. sinensis]
MNHEILMQIITRAYWKFYTAHVLQVEGFLPDLNPRTVLAYILCTTELSRPTSEFPHPFSRVKQEVGYRLSYQIVDALIWLGIWDIINEFRKKKLKLRPVTYLSGSYSSPDLPYGYLWSPHLVPKPKGHFRVIHYIAVY